MMPLSLTRRRGDKIQFIFPDEITEADLRELQRKGISLSVSQINGNQTVLSISAPLSVNVVRAELLEQQSDSSVTI